MFSLKLGTGTAIVLTDRHLVKELLDRKSSISSNRPQSYLNDLVSGSCHMLVMHYGSLWRTFRKVSHQHFMETVVEKEYVKIQEAEAVQMIYDYTVAPEQHMKHPKRFSNSIVMSISKCRFLSLC
jgi:cytochrome P450